MAKIKHSALREIQKKLRRVKPQEPEYSPPEVFALLAGEIRALKEKRYNSKEIVEILKENGVMASVAKVEEVLASAEVPPSEAPPADQAENSAIESAPAPIGPATGRSAGRKRNRAAKNSLSETLDSLAHLAEAENQDGENDDESHIPETTRNEGDENMEAAQ